MATDSGIEYVHHSWGPWRGCQADKFQDMLDQQGPGRTAVTL